MTMEEIREKFETLETSVNEIKEEIEKDAHLEFINSLKQYVNKY